MTMDEIILKAGGSRDVIEEAEAAQICQRFLKELNGGAKKAKMLKCWCLDLSGRAWKVEALRKLQPVFERIQSTVRCLKLDDIIASLDTEQGLASYAYLAEQLGDAPHVTTINLNDNAIGTRGVEVLRPFFTTSSDKNKKTNKKQLKELYLYNCGMSADVGESVKNCLVVSTNIAAQLETLDLGRNQMGDLGAVHTGALLAHCTNLRSFSYAGSRPNAGVSALLQGLVEMTQACGGGENNNNNSNNRLVELDLEESSFQSDDGSLLNDLVFVLQHSPNIKILGLNGGELQAEGLQRILNVLDANQVSLTKLNVGANELGVEGARVLRQYLAASDTRRSLQHLICDTNELGDEGVAELAVAAAECPELVHFNLNCNEIGFHGAYMLAHNPCGGKLQTLVLTDNLDLPASAARQLDLLYHSVHLDEDLPDDDEEVEEEIDELADAVAATHI